MGKIATTVEQQIEILRERGVEIIDEEEAKGCLLDIGYFRLGSYLFPFEVTFPELNHRDHKYREGTKLIDAVNLYYFDFDLRMILIRYLSRVEIALRTFITYQLSNKYITSPTWFVDPAVVSNSFISFFDKEVYPIILKKEVIKRHHDNHINDKYAPAWKTVEFMSLGNLQGLYKALKNREDKVEICKHFGVNQPAVFENYLETLRYIRNTCAHGGVLYDLNLTFGVKSGPAGKIIGSQSHMLASGLMVLKYFLRQVSPKWLEEMTSDIQCALEDLLHKSPELKEVLLSTSGLNF